MKFGSLVAGLAFIIDPAAIAQAAEIKVLGAAFLPAGRRRAWSAI